MLQLKTSYAFSKFQECFIK